MIVTVTMNAAPAFSSSHARQAVTQSDSASRISSLTTSSVLLPVGRVISADLLLPRWSAAAEYIGPPGKRQTRNRAATSRFGKFRRKPCNCS